MSKDLLAEIVEERTRKNGKLPDLEALDSERYCAAIGEKLAVVV